MTGRNVDRLEIRNLTAHVVTIEATSGSPSEIEDPDWSNPVPTSLVLESEGTSARVDDRADRLDDRTVQVGDARVAVVTMRRGRRLTDLPPSVPGTTYLVSRLTALAARHRTDLVFPLDEVREDGRIIANHSLGTYRRSTSLGNFQVIRARWKRSRENARIRRGQRAQGRVWITGLWFAVGTALLGAALGLGPEVVDTWGPTDESYQIRRLTALVALGVAVLALYFGARRWLRMQRLKEDRGTAYVIVEDRIGWHHEERSWVFGEIGSGFAAVLQVPGPRELGQNWRWGTDPEHALQWNERLDELVRSFWAVHYNDDHTTHNAVFVWAPWPVAMAFGMRATALRRGLVLRVRQRPSSGAAGVRTELELKDRALTFLQDKKQVDLCTAAPRHEFRELFGDIELIIDQAPIVTSDMTPEEAKTAAAAAIPETQSGLPILVLLARVFPGPIGGFPAGKVPTEPVRVLVHPGTSDGDLPPGRRPAVYREWSLFPSAEARTSSEKQIPWEGFDSVAHNLHQWIAEQVRSHRDHIVLLGVRIPQEIAVGLGVLAGQSGQQWPMTVFPLEYDPVHAPGGKTLHHGLTVPRLDLGSAAIPGEKAVP